MAVYSFIHSFIHSFISFRRISTAAGPFRLRPAAPCCSRPPLHFDPARSPPCLLRLRALSRQSLPFIPCHFVSFFRSPTASIATASRLAVSHLWHGCHRCRLGHGSAKVSILPATVLHCRPNAFAPEANALGRSSPTLRIASSVVGNPSLHWMPNLVHRSALRQRRPVQRKIELVTTSMPNSLFIVATTVAFILAT